MTFELAVSATSSVLSMTTATPRTKIQTIFHLPVSTINLSFSYSSVLSIDCCPVSGSSVYFRLLLSLWRDTSKRSPVSGGLSLSTRCHQHDKMRIGILSRRTHSASMQNLSSGYVYHTNPRS